MTAPRCVCGHLRVDHDLDDGCGGCAMAMVGPCRKFRPRPRHVTMDADTFAHLLNASRSEQ